MTEAGGGRKGWGRFVPGEHSSRSKGRASPEGPVPCATFNGLTKEQEARQGHEAIVPIGKSLRGRRAYVLDADGAEVPIGGVGELCIGGVSVARGYLGRPSATAERLEWLRLSKIVTLCPPASRRRTTVPPI